MKYRRRFRRRRRRVYNRVNRVIGSVARFDFKRVKIKKRIIKETKGRGGGDRLDLILANLSSRVEESDDTIV